MCDQIHNVNDLPRVIVEVSGGVVQAVYSSAPLNLSILDHDNWEAETDQAERDHFAALEKECKKPCPKSTDCEGWPMPDLTYQRVRVLEPTGSIPRGSVLVPARQAVRGYPPMGGTVLKCSPRSPGASGDVLAVSQPRFAWIRETWQ